MQLYWVTSFAEDMYQTSGRPLIDSFVRSQTEGTLFCMTERIKPLAKIAGSRVMALPLEKSPILAEFLKRGADFIPKTLGGNNPCLCKCPGGPYDPHDKRHVMPCIAHWFNKNASRWFRKVAAIVTMGDYLDKTGILAPPNDPVIVWVDADCRFERKISLMVARSWFVDKSAIFYHKSKRQVMEAGIVGYWLHRGADDVLKWMVNCYMNGGWTGLSRWDDSYVLQKAIEKTPDVSCVDIATDIGPNAKVIDYGPVGPWITHHKGLHGRKLGIMT